MNASSRSGPPRRRTPPAPRAPVPTPVVTEDGTLELSQDAVEALTDADLEAALAEAAATLRPRIRRPVLPPPPPSAAKGDAPDDRTLALGVADLVRQLQQDERERRGGSGSAADGSGRLSQEIEVLFTPTAAAGVAPPWDEDPSLAFPEPPPGPAPLRADEEAALARVAELEKRVRALAEEGETARRDLLRARQESREARDRAETSQAQLDVFQGRVAKLGEEFERLRRRSERDREEAVRFGTERLLKDLLTVIDNLERAIAHAEDGSTGAVAVVDGVRMTLGQWTAVLRKHGVVRLEVGRGATFDPAFHEAMDQSADPGVPAGAVAAVLQTGFLLHDRLLRPALVTVGAGGPPQEAAPEAGEGGAGEDGADRA
ncbi:nucleotide exchange factor GrpE [Myxococcota bacterium]|nr:nucleotide exchange factor GrpE [Myxococcota bacterium]